MRQIIVPRVIAFMLAMAPLALQAAQAVFSFGITPQQSATELARQWGPICQYLSKQTGYDVQFKTSKDLTTFWRDTDAGVFDLVYINPPRYVNAHAAQAYVAFAKDDASPLIGIIVVRKDGPKTLEALRGKQLAVPSLDSLGAAQMPQAYLRSKGIDINLVEVKSHDSVYRTVEKGLYPAGGSNLRIFGTLDLATQAQLSVLWQTEPLPPFAYAAHPRVPQQAVERIQSALLAMSGHAEGRNLLAMLNVKAIVAAKDKDYDVIRGMKKGSK